MQSSRRIVIALAAVALLLGASVQSRAQQTQPQQSQQPMVAHGQLTHVDADAQTLTVQPASGAPMVFQYTSTTRVVGAQERVEGLATMTGATVTVQYTQQKDKNTLIATSIEIQKKK